MLDFTGVRNYYIRCGYTDMRKQIDGLAALVKLEYDLDRADEGVQARESCDSVLNTIPARAMLTVR